MLVHQVGVLIALAAALQATPGAARDTSVPRQLSDDVEHYVWDLSSFYPDRAAWEAERRAILEESASIGRIRNSMGRDAKHLADALDAVSALRTRATKMTIYGELSNNLDRRSAAAQRVYDSGTALAAQTESALAFVPQEVARIGAERLERWLAEEPRLERHRIRIMRILREAPHTFSDSEQGLIASMARWPQVSADAFDALHGSALGWATMKDGGDKEIPVNLYSFKTQFPRDKRAEAARLFMARLESCANVFGLLYTRRIDADLTIARHRKFADGIDALWFLSDGMPSGSARLMVNQARQNLSLLHRYYQLRARALGFDRATHGQQYIPPPDLGQAFGIREALEIALSATAPLGVAYGQRLRAALDANCMHLPPWPQKRGVFEIFPAIGVTHPYMLTSFQPTYRGARQLTGALMNIMKNADIPSNREPDGRDFPPTYGNAIIYVGDMLFDDLVRSRAADRRTRVADALQALDLIWNNFFLTALMAELDANVQQLVIDGKTPTGEEVSQIYLHLLHEYAGPAIVDDAFAAEWMTYGVTFGSYEHQFWASAIAAAASIVEKIKAGDASGLKAVDEVYRRGDSDRSYYLLRQVGIDMSARAAYEPLFRRMNGLLNELASALEETE
jgi:oligoendopeptidase F